MQARVEIIWSTSDHRAQKLQSCLLSATTHSVLYTLLSHDVADVPGTSAYQGMLHMHHSCLQREHRCY